MSRGDPADTGVRWRPVVVELVGIPGAGKTYLSSAVCAGLTERRVPVSGPDVSLGPDAGLVGRLSRKSAATAAVGLRAPGTTLRVTTALVRSGQPTTRDLVARMVQWQVAQQQVRRARRRGGVLLLDEGPTQCLWSIGLRGDVAPMLDLLVDRRRWRSPDVLVVVRTTPAVAAARLAGRASRHSRTQRLPVEHRLAELVRGERLLDRLVEWWASTAGHPDSVLEVDGSGSANETPDRVVRRTAYGCRSRLGG